MANAKVISLVFGSDSDLEHVKQLTAYLRGKNWVRSDKNGVYMPSDSAEKIYAVFPGSVHRDLDGTVEYARAMTKRAGILSDRLVFLTCIGLNDDASGVLASQSGKQVFAIPPDRKNYNKYPGGVRVYTFNTHEERGIDIAAGCEAIRLHFDENPDWDKDDSEAAAKRENARKKLEKLREDLFSGRIEL
jgi:phosphoribosylcarboxyaminoimidazole (NCAIR) mutase